MTDTAGIDQQPIRNNSLIWGIFVILFINIGSFFLFNIFAGIVVDSFKTVRDEESNLKIKNFIL